ncbi:hypothetical protein [Streptomyces sp. CA-111067]|uniref:hypothetical protein n=1 Tax=Streptomyces sp. CA-111067 TaxID=3240046 RepID=UPI003D985A4C
MNGPGGKTGAPPSGSATTPAGSLPVVPLNSPSTRGTSASSAAPVVQRRARPGLGAPIAAPIPVHAVPDNTPPPARRSPLGAPMSAVPVPTQTTSAQILPMAPPPPLVGPPGALSLVPPISPTLNPPTDVQRSVTGPAKVVPLRRPAQSTSAPLPVTPLARPPAPVTDMPVVQRLGRNKAHKPGSSAIGSLASAAAATVGNVFTSQSSRPHRPADPPPPAYTRSDAAAPPPPYEPPQAAARSASPPPEYTAVPAGGFDPRDLTDFQLDELVHRIIGRVTRLIRTELRLDRERIGKLRDPRR